MGLILGGIFALMSFLGVSLPAASHTQGAPPAWLGPVLEVGAIVFLPLLYGIMGLVFGVISAVLFSLFARLAGGLEVELE